MTWLRRLEAWARRNPGKVDTALAVILGGLTCLIYVFVLVGGDLLSGGTGLLISFGFGWAFAWRRARPRAALRITAIAGLLEAAVILVLAVAEDGRSAGEFSPLCVLVPVIAYSVVAYGERRDARNTVIWSVIGSVIGAWCWNAGIGPDGLVPGWRGMLGMTIFLASICGVAVVSGFLVRARRLAQQALADRAERLEAEQEQERALSAADERRRIAREMHDVVAHSLSVVIAQADGARYAAAADPEIATKTLETVASTSRDALKEMRSLLGVLRTEADEAAPKAPAPDLAQIPQLVENVRGSGLQVNHHQDGQRRRGLPAGAELAAYRAVQEALTNVLKHAGPDAEATLAMNWTPHGLDIEVTDNGVGSTDTDGLGRGQQGMRERVSLYGGTADFRPGHSGDTSGYTVHVFLPYEEI